jgi:hypothetical protein
MYKVKSPILFLIFNRPKETLEVFKAISKVKPTILYIAADGPRSHKSDDVVLCKETLAIVNNIDWDCKVKTLFRNENLGCKNAVSGAITWFFENEPEGIILEDDCLPSQDFFRFCDEMLEYYRDNNKISHICGCNFQDGIKRNEYSYYYSNCTDVWGWAGWRRVWKNYDVNLSLLEKAIKQDFLATLTDSKINKLFLQYTYRYVKNGQINTWDYQYSFLNILNKTLSITPNNNMISNIGFNGTGTHTVADSIYANMPFEKLNLPLKHPPTITANKKADEYSLKKQIPGAYEVILNTAKLFIKALLKRDKTPG